MQPNSGPILALNPTPAPPLLITRRCCPSSTSTTAAIRRSLPGSRVRTQRSTAPTLLPNLDEHGAPHLRLSDLLLTTLTVQPCAPCGEHGGAAQGRTQGLEANLSRRGWQFSRFSRPSLDQFNLIHPLTPPIHHTPRSGAPARPVTARRLDGGALLRDACFAIGGEGGEQPSGGSSWGVEAATRAPRPARLRTRYRAAASVYGVASDCQLKPERGPASNPKS